MRPDETLVLARDALLSCTPGNYTENDADPARHDSFDAAKVALALQAINAAIAQPAQPSLGVGVG